MKTEICVKEKYSFLKDFIGQLPENFSKTGEEIYTGRNDVRIVEVNGLKLAVKFFKRMTLANRYIYATIRKSKAQRAYEHTDWLLRMEVSSPENVAYVNCYKYGMLYRAYYVSLYTDYKPIKDLVAYSISESEEGLKALARFTYKVHKTGIFHHDYSINNILYSVVDNQYEFSLIDNNRMKSSNYSFRKGMKNLNRLEIPVECMGIVAAEYARVSGGNDLEVLNAMVFIRLLYQTRITIKKWIKTPLHLLKNLTIR